MYTEIVFRVAVYGAGAYDRIVRRFFTTRYRRHPFNTHYMDTFSSTRSYHTRRPPGAGCPNIFIMMQRCREEIVQTGCACHRFFVRRRFV